MIKFDLKTTVICDGCKQSEEFYGGPVAPEAIGPLCADLSRKIALCGYFSASGLASDGKTPAMLNFCGVCIRALRSSPQKPNAQFN